MSVWDAFEKVSDTVLEVRFPMLILFTGDDILVRCESIFSKTDLSVCKFSQIPTTMKALLCMMLIVNFCSRYHSVKSNYIVNKNGCPSDLLMYFGGLSFLNITDRIAI